MKKKMIAARVLAVVLSASMIPSVGSIPVFAHEVSVEQNNASDVSLSSSMLQGDFSSEAYNGTDQTPTFWLQDANGTISSDKYKATWDKASRQDAGTYTLTIQAKENSGYKGKITKTFTITKATTSIERDGSSDPTITQVWNNEEVSYPFVLKVNGQKTTDCTLLDCVDTSIGSGTSQTKQKTTVATRKEPGTYPVSIKFNPSEDLAKNYTASNSYTGSLVIKKINLSDLYLQVQDKEITYDGEKHNPAWHLYLDAQHTTGADEIKLNADEYTVSPKDVSSINTYRLQVSANSKSAHYEGTAASEFSIVKNDGKKGIDFKEPNIKIDDIADQTYTGAAITPKITVKYSADPTAQKPTWTTLTSSDYSVTYEDNTEAGTAKVKVTGKGRFNNTEGDTVKKTFNIVGKPISKASITLDKTSFEYNGKEQKPVITVKNGSKTLKEKKTDKDTGDYTVKYLDSDSTNAKNGLRAQITGVGNFTGDTIKTYNITAHKISADEFTLDPETISLTYDGTSSLDPSQTKTTVKYTYGREIYNKDVSNDPAEFTIKYTNNTKPVDATITITGVGNYSGTVNKTLKIRASKAGAKSLNDSTNVKVADISAQIYSGSAKTPSVSVKYNGTTLSLGKDYEVSYLNNVNANNSASVVITGIGNYKDSVTKYFVINPTSISNASASIPQQAYTGGAIQPKFDVTFGGKTLVEGNDYRVSYKNNVNKGTATATLSGLGNFNGTKDVSFSIVDKKDADKKIYATSFTLPSTLTVSNGSSVRVTATFTPANANASSIRWSTSNASFPFSDGFTAKTTEGENGVDVKANAEGSTVITAELFDENSKSLGKQYTLVRTVKSFSDVGTDYSTTAINTLANYGYTTGSGASQEFHNTPVINGTSSSTFTPTGDVKRADFVLMLYNKAVADYAAGKSTVDPSKAAASGFADVSSSAYYAPAVNWAVANGIAEGKGNNSFDPNGTVTRAEAVTFLQRYLKGTTASSTKFSDVTSSSWYAGAVGWAVNNGVTDGTDATHFSPEQKCNRAQAATFIYRAAF